MKRIRLLLFAIPAILTACQSGGNRETIAQLRSVKIEIKEEAIEGGLEKAMASYQRFLEETPESELAPEAMRRLADLKIEREYGYLNPSPATKPLTSAPSPSGPVGPQGARGENTATQSLPLLAMD